MATFSSSFDSIFHAHGFRDEAWHLMQQQLQQPPPLASHSMADWGLSPAYWQPQPQPPPRHSSLAASASSLPDAAPDDADQRAAAAAAAAEATARWRQLPASLRRRASAQAATALLKSWLRAHADNPYPSKREKSSLAGLTNMSFAQISTWFANARRRLKKDTSSSTSAAAHQSAGEAMAPPASAGASSGALAAPSPKPKPRIWSLVETALDSKEAAPESCESTGPAVSEELSHRAIVTPEDIYCWQLCQRYITGMY